MGLKGIISSIIVFVLQDFYKFVNIFSIYVLYKKKQENVENSIRYSESNSGAPLLFSYHMVL